MNPTDADCKAAEKLRRELDSLDFYEGTARKDALISNAMARRADEARRDGVVAGRQACARELRIAAEVDDQMAERCDDIYLADSYELAAEQLREWAESFEQPEAAALPPTEKPHE